MEIVEGAIKLNNVSYRYPSALEPCINNVNLMIERGKFIVLMGATGAGKTTLIKMILAEEKPSEGKIFLN